MFFVLDIFLLTETLQRNVIEAKYLTEQIVTSWTNPTRLKSIHTFVDIECTLW